MAGSGTGAYILKVSKKFNRILIGLGTNFLIGLILTVMVV